MEEQMARSRAVAVDLGGTHFRVAVGTGDGQIEWRIARPTLAERGPEAVLRSLYDAVAEALSAVPTPASVSGIAVAAPGPLDPWTGTVYNPPNMPGWNSVPLRQLFESRFSIPTVVGNDANLAAVGEHRYGAGKGYSDVIYVTVSTGIGGGVIINDRLLLGRCGFAGEVGHMTVDVNGPVHTCGNVGCLEGLASGTAIAARAREAAAGSGIQTALRSIPLERITAQTVTTLAYDQGDEVAQQILKDAGVVLGLGMVNLIHLFDPQRLILGGGVSMGAGPLLWDSMRDTVRTRAMTACQRSIEIVPAALGDDAGLLGGVATVTSL